MTWIDYGPSPQLSDRPTPRNSAHRFKRPVMAYPEWIAVLPREAFVREEDVAALMIAEERELMKVANQKVEPATRTVTVRMRRGKSSVRGEAYVV